MYNKTKTNTELPKTGFNTDYPDVVIFQSYYEGLDGVGVGKSLIIKMLTTLELAADKKSHLLISKAYNCHYKVNQ